MFCDSLLKTVDLAYLSGITYLRALLKNSAESDDITYVANENPKGYGENNNLNFEMVSSDIKQEDFFLVINPDVAVNTGTILS